MTKICFPHDIIKNDQSTSITQRVENANAIWYPGSDTSEHVTPNLQNLEQINAKAVGQGVVVANNKSSEVLHTGKLNIKIGSNDIRLSNILHVPGITKNLLSVHKLCLDNNVVFEFDSQHVLMKEQESNKVIASRGVKDGLYKLDLENARIDDALINSCERASLLTWRNRLGHVLPKQNKKFS